ncbi:DUF4179 domain-containing protein [Dehalobacterium formicoaceticum]|uniref:DUF4179 domain-containing protein n=1 Tax=Dehalobacterium formicoaceticum TaxID=51515 RepID=A0ABT1Y7S8_9FIRM|nr:DUF4179 domain-containing protein [Dehalobacterium formicoaceticum]MCR6546942.1 DUF4179 domain-containing protein [Dehalobacterium formicoaceticum]
MNKKVANRISEILEPTEEQKERMFNSILEKHRNENTKKSGFTLMKRFKPALVAAVLAVFLITTTAFTASYLGLDIKLLNFLNPSSDEQEEYLANGAYIVDKQVKNKNGTLEIKQVIGDSNLTYILMDFTAPKSITLNDDRYRFDSSINGVDSYHGVYSVGFTKLEDENPEDNKISMVMTLNTEQSLVGGKIRLDFKELQGAEDLPKTFKEAAARDSKEYEFKPIIKGTWSTSFKLDFKDYSKTYTPNSKVMVHGHEATLKSIAISPISVTVKFESPYTEEIHNAVPFEQVEYDTYLDKFPVTINYKDGSQETTTYATGMTLGSYSSNTTISIKRFEKVINDKEIKSIEFFDLEIPIIH